MPRLVITKGTSQGRDHAIGTECVVGRGTDVDFVVDEVGVSRRHARVHREGEAYVVTDLGSRNGTWVNAQRVQAASLNDGDLIRVGVAEMVFRQKDFTAKGKPAPVAVVVPPAVSVPPRAAPAVAVPAKAPAAAPQPDAPAKKPMPKVTPARHRDRL